MLNKKFALRKLKQLGRKLGVDLIDAASPSELFFSLSKYRGHVPEMDDDMEKRFLRFVLQHFSASQAQLFQDLFVLFYLAQKRAGYFVEFGATDGITLSNSYLLEKNFGWQGILAEPARCWHAALHQNRHCIIDTRCVWNSSGNTLEFNEVSAHELSTVNTFSKSDGHFAMRQDGHLYAVETISLNDLLAQHQAPRQIDYLSIDTEGSELVILDSFDFSKYDVHILTVEHNFTAQREKIHDLLVSKGFRRVMESFSKWDDWYVNDNFSPQK